MEAFPASDDRTPTIAEDPALALSQRAKLEILFAVMLGLFLGALDQTIVGPALPTIVTQLSGNEYYVWAVTIYLLTSTISVPFWGKLSDIYGRKPIFMIGIVIFLIGSALSGLIDRLEERGYVERTRVPEDRRIVMVRVTDAGTRLIEQNDALSDELMRNVLGRLSPDELPAIARATADVRAALEATTDVRASALPGAPKAS